MIIIITLANVNNIIIALANVHIIITVESFPPGLPEKHNFDNLAMMEGDGLPAWFDFPRFMKDGLRNSQRKIRGSRMARWVASMGGLGVPAGQVITIITIIIVIIITIIIIVTITINLSCITIGLEGDCFDWNDSVT